MTAQPRFVVRGKHLTNYFQTLADLLCSTAVTSASGTRMDFGDAVDWAVSRALAVYAAGNKLIFVGNGGSAAIASHMATDYSKDGNVRSVAINDSSSHQFDLLPTSRDEHASGRRQRLFPWLSNKSDKHRLPIRRQFAEHLGRRSLCLNAKLGKTRADRLGQDSGQYYCARARTSSRRLGLM
jgi:hypothetical protein